VPLFLALMTPRPLMPPTMKPPRMVPGKMAMPATFASSVRGIALSSAAMISLNAIEASRMRRASSFSWRALGTAENTTSATTAAANVTLFVMAR
jgi:hypothetical protein